MLNIALLVFAVLALVPKALIVFVLVLLTKNPRSIDRWMGKRSVENSSL